MTFLFIFAGFRTANTPFLLAQKRKREREKEFFLCEKKKTLLYIYFAHLQQYVIYLIGLVENLCTRCG